MKTVMNVQSMKYLEENKLLSALQYGFWSNKSTCAQLLKCTNDWTKIIEVKIPVDIIYLDFAKAFDTVSHKKLFQKIFSIGLRGD